MPTTARRQNEKGGLNRNGNAGDGVLRRAGKRYRSMDTKRQIKEKSRQNGKITQKLDFEKWGSFGELQKQKRGIP